MPAREHHAGRLTLASGVLQASADIRRYGLTHTVSVVCKANRALSDVCPLVNIKPAAYRRLVEFYKRPADIYWLFDFLGKKSII